MTTDDTRPLRAEGRALLDLCDNRQVDDYATPNVFMWEIRSAVAAALDAERARHAALVAAARDVVDAADRMITGASVLAAIDALRSALDGEPTPAPLDVKRLAEAWTHVMDGRRWNGARISGQTTTMADWRAIAREYTALDGEPT